MNVAAKPKKYYVWATAGLILVLVIAVLRFSNQRALYQQDVLQMYDDYQEWRESFWIMEAITAKDADYEELIIVASASLSQITTAKKQFIRANPSPGAYRADSMYRDALNHAELAASYQVRVVEKYQAGDLAGALGLIFLVRTEVDIADQLLIDGTDVYLDYLQ